MKVTRRWKGSVFSILILMVAGAALAQPEIRRVEIIASTREARTQLVDLGVAIDDVRGERVIGSVSSHTLAQLEKLQFQLREIPFPALLDFPQEDSAYHNYDEMLRDMEEIAARYPTLARLSSIGTSLEKRPLWALEITNINERAAAQELPTIVYFGAHHAREHLSVEVPLAIAHHLTSNYGTDPLVTKWVNERHIWIVPMVNPDGAEYDIQSGSYRYWRKNRSFNSDSSRGVDLNRNYAFGWGGSGASSDPRSETYRGPAPFSEPETAAVRDFLSSLKNLTTVISYHTYSELILYPWGHRYERVPDAHYEAFVNVTQKLSQMTGYTPEQTSELYLTSGDTGDWSYGELGAFALTFELSPEPWGDGGFYPGDEIISEVVSANIPAAMYLLEIADHPFQKREVIDPIWSWPHFPGRDIFRWLTKGALWSLG